MARLPWPDERPAKPEEFSTQHPSQSIAEINDRLGEQTLREQIGALPKYTKEQELELIRKAFPGFWLITLAESEADALKAAAKRLDSYRAMQASLKTEHRDQANADLDLVLGFFRRLQAAK